MLCEPLKLTCNQSGKLFGVASFQPPPLPQLAPLRTLSIAALGA